MINKGGPAFPVDELTVAFPGQVNDQHFGMTLRDYFAAKAMQGAVCARLQVMSGAPSETIFEAVAADAYCYADAMLKAREEQA